MRKGPSPQWDDPGFGAQIDLVSNPASTTVQTLKVGPIGHLPLLQTAPSSGPQSPTLLYTLWGVSRLSHRSLQGTLTLLLCFLCMLHPSPHLLYILTHPSRKAHVSTAQTLLFQNCYFTYCRRHTIQHFIIYDVSI